jgi:O-antigen/teichoic acid export membrane protein
VPEQPAGVLARNAFFLLLGQIGSTVLAIVLNATLARTLGAADFGIYFLLVTMSTFAYVVVEWGQSALVVREAARRPEATGELLGSALSFRVGVAALAVVATGLVTRLLGYDGRTQALSALMVCCSLPLALSQPYTYLFRGRDRMELEAAVTVIAKAAVVAGTVLVLVLDGHLVGVVLAQGVGGLAALVAAVLFARRIGIARASGTWSGVRSLASQGTAIAAFFVIVAAEPYLHAILLSKLAPAVTVGWYGAARNIMGVLLAPATILSTAAFPQFARAGSREELLHAIRQTLRLLLGLGALGAVGTYLFADVAVSLIYGHGKFDPAARVLQLFAPVLLVFFIDMLFASVVTATGKTPRLAVAKIASVAASTLLAVQLVPYCQEHFGNGGLGLVLAFGASEVVMVLTFLALVPKGALDRGMLADVLRTLLVAAATLTLFRALPPLPPFVAVPATIAVFTGLTFAVGLVSRRDLERIGTLLEAQGREEVYDLRAAQERVSGAWTAPRWPPEQPPVVSIVINNFNYARFLAQSIDSGLAQTYPHTEVVVVDDASHDGSAALIHGYGDRVVPVLQDRNRGQGAAVNAGFARSRGDIVIFLDADDYLYPHAAARVVASWRGGLGKLQYRLDLVDVAGEKLDLYPAPEIRFDSGDVTPELLRTGRYETTVTSGNAFPRDVLRKVLPVPEDAFRISADGYLVTAVPFHGPVASLEEPLGAYRLHGANAWAQGDAPAGERLRRWLEHDAHKYRVVADQARAVGVEVPPSLGMRDHHHLATRLASLCADPESHPYPEDSRLGLALRGAFASRIARLPWKRRSILAVWFLAVGSLPRPVALRAISWRLSPSSRSPSVARLLKTVRRMAR